MLRIILTMLGEVLKFLFIWAVVMVCIASVASLLFGALPQYSTFIGVFYIIFDTSFGNYDFSVFEGFTGFGGEVFCKIFITSTVLINNIVLLNFVIAILADTYSKLA